MPFEKGKSGNPQGRGKGNVNKTSKEAKGLILAIVEKQFSSPQFEKDLNSLDPQKRIELLIKLLEFILPKAKDQKLNEEEIEQKRLDRIDNFVNSLNHFKASS